MVLGLIVGFACMAGIGTLAHVGLQFAWPEYAAAVPEKAYTLPMLWSRLSVAALLTLLSAAAATLVADNRHAGWVFGSLFLLASLPSHLHDVWADYPPWYHAVYLLSLVPLGWLGGRLVR